MAEGHGREQWAHTSVICALFANAHRDPKKQRPFKPDDFNPYVDRHHRARHADGASGDVIEVNNDTVSLLRSAFTGAPQSQKGL